MKQQYLLLLSEQDLDCYIYNLDKDLYDMLSVRAIRRIQPTWGQKLYRTHYTRLLHKYSDVDSLIRYYEELIVNYCRLKIINDMKVFI